MHFYFDLFSSSRLHSLIDPGLEDLILSANQSGVSLPFDGLVLFFTPALLLLFEDLGVGASEEDPREMMVESLCILALMRRSGSETSMPVLSKTICWIQF